MPGAFSKGFSSGFDIAEESSAISGLQYTLNGSRATQINQKAPGDTRNLLIDFSPLLGSGEFISDDSVATSAPAGLTISGLAASSGALEINGASVPAGQALQATVSGGVTGTMYSLALTAVTAGSQTIVGTVLVMVQ